MTHCLGCMAKLNDHQTTCPFCGYNNSTPAAEAMHMEPGSILRERYIVGRVLGFGGFGVTYIGWDALLEQTVAIKEYLPSEFSTRMPGQTQVTVFNGDKAEQFADGLTRFVDEAQRLAQFHNAEGIVRIFDSFEDNSTAYIVMEHLDGETLKVYMEENGSIPPEDAADMLMPVMESLQVVHEAGIIHRDIAPDNIFLTRDGRVKLIDFGAARFATTSHSRSLTVIIKPGFSPEEQYRSRGDQGTWTDVYAIGATLYKMITGKTPPDALERRAMFESKKKDILKPLLKYCDTVPENTENAVLNAMNVRIEDRTPDMAGLIAELTSEEPVKRRAGKIKKIDVLKWPLWAKISIAAAAVLVLTLSILFATGVIRFDANLRTGINIPEGMSRVPSLISDTLEEAEERLDDAVLLYQITGKEYSTQIPADLVLTQSLPAGSVVESNSMVDLTVSGGAEDNSINEPDSEGLLMLVNVQYDTEEKALKKLEAQGMKVEISRRSDEKVGAGVVISMSPDPESKLEPGSTVKLVISTGPESFSMPNVIGENEDSAKSTLNSRGLSVSVSYERSSGAEGTVLKQSVHAGEEVKRGQSITLTVNSGQELISVENVVGQQESDARSILQGQGLKVSVSEAYSSSVAAGVVIRQSPNGGSSRAEGTTIYLTVSKGREPETTAKTTTTPTAATTTTTTKPTTTTTKAPYTVKFYHEATYSSSNPDDPDGGFELLTSRTVNAGGKISPLPSAPNRSGYTFQGWYTSSSGGTQFTTNSTVTSNITLYARWTENQLSGWVPISDLPAGAKAVNYKWIYGYMSRLTTYNPTAPSEYYTQYQTPTEQWGDYGAWSSWSTNNPGASDARRVESRTNQVLSGYNLVCYLTMTPDGTREYRNFSVNGNYATYGLNPNYGQHVYREPISLDSWNAGTTIAVGGYSNAPACQGYNRGTTAGKSVLTRQIFWVESNRYSDVVEYRYQDRSKETIYYWQRIEEMHSTPSTTHTAAPSGSNIIDAREYVQYRS